ncbi:glucosaminidase [Vibrio sp. SM6]|uniref:Glucosaminidase n=1 Tax=Vibrio agarilyticus TaxID=2726741 RepID=A0A7X8YGD7_9VIBR|nr:glucosaminidase domain-containing protein [Vibrio agarilyticus]NLS12579.1 glucosaminidase [Vibrio agarilyticus]
MHKSVTSLKVGRIALIVGVIALSAVGPYLFYTQPHISSVATARSDVTPNGFENHSPVPNFGAIKETKQKKQAFFDYFSPIVALENQRIIEEREFLETLTPTNVTEEEYAYADRLGKLYSMPLDGSPLTQQWLDEMLMRVNVLPEALVLTQAANESAWGTSRFAKEANNFFGQWCYSKGCGIIPAQRSAGATHEVEKFDTAQEAVHRYFMNVNRNRAYQPLREIRDNLSEKGENLQSTNTALQVSEGLLAYSERGQHYVKEIQEMIRYNQPFWTQ